MRRRNPRKITHRLSIEKADAGRMRGLRLNAFTQTCKHLLEGEKKRKSGIVAVPGSVFRGTKQ